MLFFVYCLLFSNKRVPHFQTLFNFIMAIQILHKDTFEFIETYVIIFSELSDLIIVDLYLIVVNDIISVDFFKFVTVALTTTLITSLSYNMILYQ